MIGLLVEQGAIRSGIGIVAVDPRHALGGTHLPFHHRDPFDRMLVAQAKIEGLTVVGRDSAFDAYGVKRIW